MADVAKSTPMASAVASPSTMNDSNAVDSDLTSSQKQEFALGNETGVEISSPSQQIVILKITPIETTGAASPELSASTEVAAGIASPSSTSTSNILPREATRAKSQLLPVSTSLEIGSPSLTIGKSNEVANDSISSEMQELFELNAAHRYINRPYSEGDKVNTVISTMANPRVEDLAGSTEDVANMGHFNPDVDASVPAPNFYDNSLPKVQELIEVAYPTDDVCSSRRVTEGQNGTSKVLERNSPRTEGLMALTDGVTVNDLLSSDINAPIMVPELIEASSDQESELPFGPFSVEGTPDFESPSLALEIPTTSDVCKPIEVDRSEMHSQPTSGELAPDTTKNLELIELRSIKTPKHDSSTGLESTEVSPNLSLSSNLASSKYSRDDALKYGLARLLEANNSSKASSALDISSLEVCDAKHPSEAIQASLTETPELNSTAADTLGKVSPSLASSEATLEPKIEMVHSEIQNISTLDEAVPEMENPHNSAGVFNFELGFVDKKAIGTMEPSPSSGDTLKPSPSSSSPAPPVMTLDTPDMSSEKSHGATSSETSPILSSPPSWIGGVDEFSKVAEMSTFATTHLPLLAESHHGSNDDGTQHFRVEDGTTACGSGNTMIQSRREDIENKMKSAIPNMYSQPNSGWAFAELGQNHRDDMTISDHFQMDRQAYSKVLYGANSPISSSADKDVPSLFDEEATINAPGLDVQAAHTQKIEPSVADELTTPERFEFIISKAEDRSAPVTILNNHPFSLSNIKEELDTNDKSMDEAYPLPASVDTGVEMKQLLNYQILNAFAYEPVVKSSPGIKMEPMSIEDISHMDSLALATADHKTVQRLNDEWSSKIREGRESAPSRGAASDQARFVEAKPSTMKAEPKEPISTDMQLSPVSTSNDTYSAHRSPEDTAKCSNKRVRVEAEDNREEQNRPAKKLRQQFVDAPQPKINKNFSNQTIELYVGPASKCVLAEKHILTKSPFFALLFNQKVSRAYRFPRMDTYALATIVHWLHYSNIQSIAEDYKADEIFHTTHMIKVYLLCSKLQLRSLMNLAVELLGHGYLKNKSAPPIEEIGTIYSETDHLSGLQIYMAAWARCRQHAPLQKFMMAGPWDQIRFKALCKKHPDLRKDMGKLDESSDPESPISLNPRFHEICWYHDHPHGERCGVSGKTFESACNGIEPRPHEPI